MEVILRLLHGQGLNVSFFKPYSHQRHSPSAGAGLELWLLIRGTLGTLMQEKAKEIYMTFLSSKASSQVNVEGQSRLSETILETPHPLMFQKLQDQIFNLMKYDSYSRFLKSDIFLNHKKSEEQEENSAEAQTAAKRASRIYNT
ncbi:regulator of G-protein signaling 10 isoform X3 [Cyanistes caeruleus]|uniref:regulator of G-protein signaling 10 isoform X3 n=1 Tax=Cyanistes caeruleus TaxID=156563 RepID=UPI000CDA80AA|nr:regulator of G-protein signaling 10 isoform X3 [Cyanistes caeruleus]